MAKIKRSEDRNYTPKPELLDADLKEEATPPPTLDPQDATDEGDLTLTDDLDVGPEEPPPDLNEEQQDYSEEVQERED
jgi:hypothetical protein